MRDSINGYILMLAKYKLYSMKPTNVWKEDKGNEG